MSMGSSSSMKVHTFARGFWDTNNNTHHQQQIIHDLPSLTLGCKRFRPLAPKLNANNVNVSASGNGNSFDLKSFIKPENEIRKFASYDEKRDSVSHHHVQSVETHPGGTRWNPTQEQIGILEMLYKGGMRTPNAQQIEQITEQLAKYGKIEGKNVFYWFQNHKARERQKQKRNILGLTLTTTTTTTPTTPTSHSDASILALSFDARVENEQKQLETSPYKRKLREWTFEYTTTEDNNVKKKNQDYEGDQTLELFPLHPERR